MTGVTINYYLLVSFLSDLIMFSHPQHLLPNVLINPNTFFQTIIAGQQCVFPRVKNGHTFLYRPAAFGVTEDLLNQLLRLFVMIRTDADKNLGDAAFLSALRDFCCRVALA